MNLVYGALLLHSAGKPVTEESIKKVASAVGDISEAQKMQIKALVAALEGVDIDAAKSKAAMPVAVAAAPSSGAAPAAEKKEEPEEDKEKKAEEAAAGLSALFG